MELRPCILRPGDRYDGPQRVPVRRAQAGVSYRPLRQFRRLKSAVYDDDLKLFRQMADERRVERKAEEEQIKIFGPQISILDPNVGPLDSSCKILKKIEHGNQVRLYYRRKEWVFHFIIYIL